MKDIDLHEWQRYSTVFSLLFRNQFGNKIKACDQQLVHYIGVDPRAQTKSRHWPHTSDRSSSVGSTGRDWCHAPKASTWWHSCARNANHPLELGLSLHPLCIKKGPWWPKNLPNPPNYVSQWSAGKRGVSSFGIFSLAVITYWKGHSEEPSISGYMSTAL